MQNQNFICKNPAGTQSEKSFRLKGKSVPSLCGGGKGDLIAKVRTETPINLNTKQKELLQQFGKTCGKKHHPESNGFFDKVKSILSNGFILTNYKVII